MVGFDILDGLLDRLLGASESEPDPDGPLGRIRVKLKRFPKRRRRHRSNTAKCMVCKREIKISEAYKSYHCKDETYDVICSEACFIKQRDMYYARLRTPPAYVHDWRKMPGPQPDKRYYPPPKPVPTRIPKPPEHPEKAPPKYYKLYRTCATCHKQIYVKHAYRIMLGPKDYYGDRRIDEVYCSRECYQKVIDRAQRDVMKRHGMGYFELLQKRKEEATLAEMCDIVKRHDEELKDDPERLDIGKFIETYVPCLHDVKKRKPDEPDYTITSGFRQRFI